MICGNGKAFLVLAMLIAAALVPDSQAQSTSKVGIPILVYHDIQTKEEGQTKKDVVGISKFKEQMRYLHEQGYQTLALSEMEDYLSGRKLGTNKVVMIQIDDGLQSVANALPVLTDYGFKAGFSIVPNQVGRWGVMSWEDIGKIASNPRYDILSHTMSHSCWMAGEYDGRPSTITEMVEKEIADSRRIISEKIGKEVNALVWPCGIFNTAAARYAVSKGYKWLFTMHDQMNYPKPDHRDINRIYISGTCGLREFVMTLSDGKSRECHPARTSS